MRDEKSHWLKERSMYTIELDKSPYDLKLYLQRALCHDKLGFPDLAASDAYRALLLTDEVLDEEGEYHDQAVEALELRTTRKITNRSEKDGLEGNGQDHEMLENGRLEIDNRNETEESWYEIVAKGHACRCYEVLARTLSECGDLRSSFDFATRGLMAFPGNESLQALKEQILKSFRQQQLDENPSYNEDAFNPREDLPENGSVRREIYPWNDHESDRFSNENLSFINAEIKKSAPKCEVRVVELPFLANDTSTSPQQPTTTKQLGIFTTSPISPNETLLLEPSVLTSSTRLHDPFCDACSTRLPPISPTTPPPSCPNCEDTLFCSPTCHDHAQTLYHPAICGIPDFDIIAKDPTPRTATPSLYTLLLARTIAMAETQHTHPLDLPQIKYLWGDFATPNSVNSDSTSTKTSLPFSFTSTIQQPLHLLSALALDPFAPSTRTKYDTWTINTLLAKYRGVAHAQMNPHTGIPEVAGVHWLWSLANHSCAPNVRWEWGRGGMGFVARGSEDVVRWGGGRGEGEGGIGVGEEVLSHYCDVELEVRGRREWAVGALGGVCVCERCVWEAGEG